MSIFDHRDFKDYEDFRDNFKLDIPKNFNFGFDCVDALAETYGERLALRWVSDDEPARDYTFADMKKYSDAAARYFLSLGISKGDRVMLILKRRVQFWFAIVALIKIGAIAIPATHHLIASDIVYRNRSASVNAIVAADDERLLGMVEAAMPESPSVSHLIRIGEKDIENSSPYEWKTLSDGISANLDGAPLPRVTENKDNMLLYFTSGTTDYPKMVLHDHVYPLAHIVTAKYWHNLSAGSLHLTLSDTGWGKAVWGKLFGQWLCKATVLVYDHDKLAPARLLKVIAQNKVTSFCAPPTVYKVLMTADFSGHDLSSLAYATSAGEPLNDAIYEEFLKRTGLKIYEAYGQTETTAIVLTSPYTKPRPGSLGKLNPLYDVVFIDAEGRRLTGAGEGEICLDIKRGEAGVFTGYYRNVSMTDYAWRGGLYHTGDLASIGEDGYVYFIGRADDIIKSAGYRIGPFEVESVVQQHPAVLECAVTGVPDKLRGQAIRVSIILRKEFAASDALRKEIRAFVKANAASYKIPRIIEFVDEFPRTVSGKVRRNEIRKKGRPAADADVPPAHPNSSLRGAEGDEAINKKENDAEADARSARLRDKEETK
jgi:acetyl-CoA synthetase